MPSLVPTTRGPAPLELSIATAILKTKPQGVSVREYITSLRPFILLAPDQSELLHFDATAYWNSLYCKSSNGVDELKSQLAEREFEVRQLKEKIAILQETQIKNEEDEEVIPDSLPMEVDLTETANTIRRSPRKRKIAEIDETEPEAQVEDDLQSLHSCITKQSRDLFVRNIQLRKLVEENNAFLAPELALEMQLTAATITKLLDRTAPFRADSDTLNEVTIRLIKLTISHFFQAFDRLVMHRLTPDMELKNPIGAAIYSIVELFKNCVQSLSDAARAESDTISTRWDTTSFSSRASPARSSRLPESSQLANQIQSIMTTIMSSASHSVARKVNKDGPSTAYRDLLEGLQYLLMTRTGKLLQVLTFGEVSRGSIEQDLLNLEKGKTTQGQQNSLIAAAQAEARYIFPLVKSALAVGPANNTATKKHANMKLPQSTLHRCMTADPLARLQRTITQGVFGVNEEDDLEDLLRLPAKVTLKGKGAQGQKHDDGGAWFIKAMWEIVGWDFLERGV